MDITTDVPFEKNQSPVQRAVLYNHGDVLLLGITDIIAADTNIVNSDKDKLYRTYQSNLLIISKLD